MFHAVVVKMELLGSRGGADGILCCCAGAVVCSAADDIPTMEGYVILMLITGDWHSNEAETTLVIVRVVM